jgi:hypothetical protein
MKTVSKHRKFQRAIKLHGVRNIYLKEKIVFMPAAGMAPTGKKPVRSSAFAGLIGLMAAMGIMGRTRR